MTQSNCLSAGSKSRWDHGELGIGFIQVPSHTRLIMPQPREKQEAGGVSLDCWHPLEQAEGRQRSETDADM